MTTRYIQKYLSIIILLVFLPGFCFAQVEDKDSLQIENVKQPMVNIGYGIMPAWMVTGAVSSVGGANLEKSFTEDLGNTLTGRVNGLTTSGGGGEPGSQSPSLQIRGLNTFGNGKSPLVLVDGFELPFGQLEPEEVESVVALKDAAATAIYGSKGANGVLLVTTKRGSINALQVSFKVQHGYQTPYRIPQYLGSYDYAKLFNEASVNDGNPAVYTESDLQAYRSGSDPFLYPDVNWYNQVLRKSAPMTKYNLNFKGGNQTVRYFVMLNMLTEDGLIKKTKDLTNFSENSDYRRFNFRTNVDLNLSKRLSANLTMGGSVMDKTNPVNNSLGSLFSSLSLTPPNAFPVFNPNSSYGGSNLYSNPWGDILENGNYSSNGLIFQASYKMTEQLDMITEGLSISAEVNFNTSFSGLSNKSRDYARYALSTDESGAIIYTKIGENSSLVSSESQSDQWRSNAFRVFLNYSRSFGMNDIEGVLLYNTSDYTLGIGGLPYVDKGVFGRFTFANSKKYIAEMSFGYNATDNFPDGSRWGLFPSISLGWIASNEDFLKDSQTFQYLKFRTSYGLTGNDNIGGKRYMFYQDWGGVGSYVLGTANTSNGSYGELQVANPDVTWEKQKQFNFGIEATLWKNIDLSFDIFSQSRYDILTKPYDVVPDFLGLTLPDLNLGKVDNKGFEGKIRYNSSDTKEFQYYAQFDVWYAKNKIVANSEAVQLNEYLYRTGHPVNQPFVLEAIGFFKDEADINASPKQIFDEVQPGDIKYKDQNNDGIIDVTDKYPVGYTNIPELTAGISAGFSYKRFDLDVLFQGATNRTTYLSGNYFEAFQNNGKISEVALGRWTESTKDVATYPRLTARNNQNNYQQSTFWQRDGSFLNLRSLELGYTLPEKLMNKTGGVMRFYLNGTNLFTLDKLAPEERANSGYPSVRTYSIGIKFQF